MKYLLVVILLCSCSLANAQSFSEMSIDSFKKFSKGDEKRAPGSPFSKSGISTAEDLALDDLTLTGIAVNATNAYALVSGYLVQVGDRIAGFKVDGIEKGRVTLKRLDEVYVLTVGGM